MIGYLDMIEKVIVISITKSRKTLFLYRKKEILFLIRRLRGGDTFEKTSNCGWNNNGYYYISMLYSTIQFNK